MPIHSLPVLFANHGSRGFIVHTDMPTFNDLTYFDYAVAFLFLFFMARGLWIGCMRQLAAFFALVGSYYLAGQYADQFIPFTERFVTNPKLIFLVSFAGIFLIAALIFSLIGKLLHRFLQISLFGGFDRLLGLVLGGVKAAVVASMLYMVLASSLSSTNELLRKSISSPYLKVGAELLQSLINDPRLRTYFLEKEPAIVNGLPPARALSGKERERKETR